MPQFIWRAFFLAVAVAVPVQLSASAQEQVCSYPRCRAEFVFEGTCHKPRVGAKLFFGRVLGVSLECPNTIVQIQVQDRELIKLPPNIEIRLGGCTRFYGKVGDLVQFAVEQPSSDVRRYALACLH